MQYKIEKQNDGFIYSNPAAKLINKIKWDNTNWVWIELSNETPTIKKRFEAFQHSFKYLSLGSERFHTLHKSGEINQLIDLIQELDPLPLIFFTTLKEFGINLPKYLIDIKAIAEEKKVEEAIDEVLKVSNDFPEKMVKLANYYQEKQNNDAYLLVLKAIPSNNPFFAEANKNLIEFYNTINNNSLESLKQKFKAAYNAQLPESDLYFSQLAGEKGIKHLLPMQFGANADFIISLAMVIREKNQTIATLKGEKASELTPRFF